MLFFSPYAGRIGMTLIQRKEELSLVDFKRSRQSPVPSTEQPLTPILNVKSKQKNKIKATWKYVLCAWVSFAGCAATPASRTILHPQVLLATQVVPPGLWRPQGCSRTVCKPRGVFLALVKTILKSHFPLIKYGFVLQMHAWIRCHPLFQFRIAPCWCS